jgi:signal transduction histidine kinase
LLTIGEDLIHDHHAAVIELVKNSFDADAQTVTISIMLADDDESLLLVIADDGHGMSRKTVVDKWLVPSTQDKITRRKSPGGRVMQGRKGIGRYAASILGSTICLETVSLTQEKTVVHLEWGKFEAAKYLSDVEVQVTSSETNDAYGTKLIITGGEKHLSAWSTDEIGTLEFELRKLISPVERVQSAKTGKSTFSINLSIDGYFYNANRRIEREIQPIPLFDFYDYRIAGEIDKSGRGSLTFKNQKAKNTLDEVVPIDLNGETGCGNLSFDIRVYDRDSVAIDQIIRRGLKDEDNNYLGKNEAKRLLNKNNGLGVYRNGFRIRPLGDPDFDWLRLNEQRVQNPSMKIGSNQVIGFVDIESEELSFLEEKSARDGLKDNNSFKRLREISNIVISKLEERRFSYRSKAGLSRSAIKVEKELDKLFNFEEIKEGISVKLKKAGLDKKLADEIVSIVAQKENESNEIVEDIRRAVAIYQGQATLGKIINVILHEGRRPLNYFKNQIPNLYFWIKEFKKDSAEQYLEEILPIASGIAENSKIFVDLFGKLDPLAAAKRKKKEKFDLFETVENSFYVFEEEMIIENISKSIKSDDENVEIFGWPADIYIIMTNLIENSLYWISNKNLKKRSISVTVHSEDGKFQYLDYKDTGPGIEKHLIESQVIFEPEFSTKPSGTGLGLAIAGEAASRNGLQMQVFESDDGAFFRIEPTIGGDQWKS